MVVPKYPTPIVGGLEKQAYELSKQLVKQSICVSVLSTKFYEDQKYYEIEDDVVIHRIKSNRFRILRFIFLIPKIFYFMLLNKNSFDIVHLHTIGLFSLYVLLVAKILNKKIVLKMANVGKWGLLPFKNSLLGRLQLKIFKTSDVIIAMSNESKTEVFNIGYPLSNIFMSPNGISIPNDTHNIETKESKICNVIFVGRLDKQKNIDNLLRVWSNIQASCKVEARLEICGEGPLEDRLKKLATKLKIKDTVFFRGHIKNIFKNLARSDIFILPSLAEGNSNAILEAMASGLPILASNVGGSMMQVGECGKLYIHDVEDNKKLFNNLKELLENKDKSQKIGIKMKIRARDIFSMEKISKGYISMYQYVYSGNCSKVYKISNKVFD